MLTAQHTFIRCGVSPSFDGLAHITFFEGKTSLEKMQHPTGNHNCSSYLTWKPGPCGWASQSKTRITPCGAQASEAFVQYDIE
jgi:hypothetical protein